MPEAEETVLSESETEHNRYQAMARLSNEIQAMEAELEHTRKFMKWANEGMLANIEIGPVDGRAKIISISRRQTVMQSKIVQMLIDHQSELIMLKRARLKEMDNGRWDSGSRAGGKAVQPNAGPPRGQDTKSDLGAEAGSA